MTFGLVLLISVAAKIAVQNSGEAFSDPSHNRAILVQQLQHVVNAFSRRNVNIEVIRWNERSIAASVQIGACKLMFFPLNPKGWDAESAAISLNASERIGYVTRWGIFERFPAMYSMFDLYYTYFCRALGSQRSDGIVLSVLYPAANCDLNQIPWDAIY